MCMSSYVTEMTSEWNEPKAEESRKKQPELFRQPKRVTWQDEDEIFICFILPKTELRFITLERNNLMNGFLSFFFLNAKILWLETSEVVGLWKFGSYQING